VGALEVGQVTIRPAEGTDTHYAVHGGFVEVSNDHVSLLTDVAEAAEHIDAERASAARERAKAAVAADRADADAAAALRRAELRLAVAGVPAT
jgi:F-type H+-transporting ATPase subunit epsilon